MTSAHLGCRARQRLVDAHHLRSGRREEFIDLGHGASLKRAHNHLRVHSRRNQQLVAGGEVATEPLDSDRVLGVVRIEERDDDVGVERYSRHSSRSPSR